MRTDDIRIVTTDEHHIPGVAAAQDAVARERRYLALLEGYPVDACREFVRSLSYGRGVQMVAVAQDEHVVGWCDVVRYRRAVYRHAGALGMGLLSEYRGRGIGRRLATAVIAAAHGMGIERIELEVFGSNEQAIALYRSLGFETEGVRRAAARIDGVAQDVVIMARVAPGGGDADRADSATGPLT